MSWSRRIHLYCGLVLSIFLLMFAITGGALIFKDDIQRARYPALAEPLAEANAERHARAFASIMNRFPRGIRTIRTPREGAALYHVYLDDSEAFVSQDGSRLIDRRQWHDSLVGVLSELHFHLAMGRSGSTFVGATGVLLAAMVLTGLILFWPFRRRFGLPSLLLRSTSRLAWSRMHRDLGLLASMPILLFALTAAGVVFYGASQAVLGALTWSGAHEAEPPVLPVDESPGTVTARYIAAAQQALPGARLMSYNPPAAGDAVHYFRFRKPGEPHPYGRSAVYVDGRTGDVLRAYDATKAPRGERAAQWLYPLHAVDVGGGAYATLAFLSAFALAVMSISGPAIYIQARHRKGKGRSLRSDRPNMAG